jgi:hypothetical protein
MPVQLGAFRNSPTLRHVVCRACNQYFGDELERFLGRDSYEGLLRLQKGIVSASDARRFRPKRVELRLPSGSAWEGVRFRLSPNTDNSGVIVDLPAQIGVRRSVEARFHYFLEDEFASGTDEAIGLGRGARFAVCSIEETAHNRLLDLVRKRVPTFRIDGPMPPPPFQNGELVVEVLSTLDCVLARAIAKIGFNYLAWATSTPFVLRREFDGIRRFIRYGEGTRPAFVTIRKRPILAQETTRYRMTEGHIVTVEWFDRGSAIRALVSPFNSLTYEIVLCTRFTGVWWPIERGSLFDWKSRMIAELCCTRRPSRLLVAPYSIVLPPG